MLQIAHAGAAVGLVDRDAEQAERWGRYGMVLEAHGFTTEAQTAYMEATVLDAGEVRWIYYLAATFDSSAPQQAVDLYLRSIELDPAYAPAHVRVAQTLEKLAQYDEARRHYERAAAKESSAGSRGAAVTSQAGLGRALCMRAGPGDLERVEGLIGEIEGEVESIGGGFVLHSLEPLKTRLAEAAENS